MPLLEPHDRTTAVIGAARQREVTEVGAQPEDRRVAHQEAPRARVLNFVSPIITREASPEGHDLAVVIHASRHGSDALSRQPFEVFGDVTRAPGAFGGGRKEG